jgi:hypothetical protein
MKKNQSYSRRAHTESDILVSMKMRLVMNRLKKLLMLPILDKYPLKNIAIHARLGKQLQRRCRFRWLSKCIDTTKHKLYYMGYHICCKFHEMQERYPYWSLDDWERLISSILTSMIKIIRRNICKQNGIMLSWYFVIYSESLSGSTHILLKCITYGNIFHANPHKVLKKLKGTKYSELRSCCSWNFEMKKFKYQSELCIKKKSDTVSQSESIKLASLNPIHYFWIGN